MATADQIVRQQTGVTRYQPVSQTDRDARKVWGQSRLTSSQAGLSPTTGGKTVEQQVAEQLGATQIPTLAEIAATLGLSTGGGGTGAKASDILAAQKFEYEKAKDRLAAEQAARSLAAYQQMLSSGGYRSGTDQILGMIESQAGTTRGNVEDAYKRALENIGAGYQTAQDLTTQGYGALEQYLRANPNNPYANVQVSAPAAPDAMQQILSAYGVAAEPVLAQVAAEQAAAQQGAAGFQNLLNALGAAAQQSDLSRLAEMQMASTLAGQTLGTQRATYGSQAEQARANALAQIESQLAQARLEQEIAAQNRRQQIEDAIIAAGGSVSSGTGAGAGAGAGTGGETEEDRRRREALAQMLVAASGLGAGTGANMGPMAYAI